METLDLFSSITIRAKRYPKMILKWQDETIGYSDEMGFVSFTQPKLNKAVSLITGGSLDWHSAEFRKFLEERLPSRSRRDIEKILRRCKLTEYDEISLAVATRALNAKDVFWLALNENEKFNDIVNDVFSDIFVKRLDLKGGSLVSPEGVNIKSYGVSNGFYGLYKQRLHPFSSDVESEVAVYELSKLLGVECCPSWIVYRNGQAQSFSKFEYDFSQEYIVHVRRLFVNRDLLPNEYENLLSVMPQFKLKIQKMILLDFITRQTDRHTSNIALKVRGDSVSFYKLYDNGRSLFYEDKEEFIEKALMDVPLYSTEFGLEGTYYDYVQDIASEEKISKIINLGVPKDQVYWALRDSGITGNRLEGSVEWVCKCLDILRKI